MSSPTLGNRRLSNAFDNFRNKVRRGRIDSLLSPPKPDSGAESSPSEWEGVPLTSTESLDVASHLGIPKYGREPLNFTLASDFETGVGSGTTSPDENKRIAAALGDFKAECTEPDEFERFLWKSDGKPNMAASQKQGHVSPTGSVETGIPTPPDIISLRQADSLMITNFEIGVPLERTKAHQYENYQTQVQTEPQTAEQTYVQSTYVSLDQMVHEADWMMQEREVPRTTVDGLRLDARPLLRHSGISAPPHSQLRIDTLPVHANQAGKDNVELDHEAAHDGYLRNHFTDLDVSIQSAPLKPPAIPSFPLANEGTDFSSSSEEAHNYKYPDCSHWRNVGNVAPPELHFSSERSRLIHDAFCFDERKDASTSASPRSRSSSTDNVHQLPVARRSNKRTRRDAFITSTTQTHHEPNDAPMRPVIPMEQKPLRMGQYSHTPPNIPLPPSNYTNLHNIQHIRAFHNEVVTRLQSRIASGDIKASQIPVKERVRRISGAGGARVAQGVRKIGRAGKEVSKGLGEAMVGSGAVGVGWRDASAEAEGQGRVGERSGLVYYGAGFV